MADFRHTNGAVAQGFQATRAYWDARGILPVATPEEVREMFRLREERHGELAAIVEAASDKARALASEELAREVQVLAEESSKTVPEVEKEISAVVAAVEASPQRRALTTVGGLLLRLGNAMLAAAVRGLV